MKFLLIILCTVLYTHSLQAQKKITHEILGFWELAHIGQGFTVSYKGNIKQHAFILGLRYHQNTIVKDNQNQVFKNRFYADTFRERLGLNMGYNYNFKLKHSDITPFFFYNLQIARMGTKNEVYWAVGTQNGQTLYMKDRFERFSMTSIDNTFGLGFSARLYKQIYLYMQAGGGMIIYKDVDPRLFIAGGPDLPLIGSDWELSSRFSFGLSYHLKSKK